MRIGLDGKILSLRVGGTGRYAINLTREILDEAAASRPDLEFVVFTGPRSDPDVVVELGRRCETHRLTAGSSVIRSLTQVPRAIRRLGIDVFHGMDHVGIPFTGRDARYVVTVHDVIPLILPETFTPRHRLVVRAALARVRRRADRVLVPSEAVKRDLVERVSVNEGLVVVTPEACDRRFRPVDAAAVRAVAARHDLPERYVLAVGTLEPRKNLTRLLEAFSLLLGRRRIAPDYRLVLVGARGWLEGPIFRAVKELELEGHVLFTGFVADEDLPAVYTGASLFVFPSLHEGFGLPLLEAMACGAPVVASNVSSLPEVAGSAAVLVDPHDVEALAGAIAGVLEDDARRERLVAAGLARADEFSWRRTARQTLDVYSSLA
ncbi:MAG: glycosyltransferase family 1 protein [Acidobacteria bacterium]|nr:glycosyltransferase family 1 protein [Acidobacteriota bacterium]